MKLKYLLTEAQKMVIAKKDAPDWVKPILGNSFPNIEVKITDEANLHQWHDYDVMDVYFFIGDGKGGGKATNSYSGASEDNVLTASKESQALYAGTSVRLWPNSVYGKPMMILITHTLPKKAELIVHPENIPKQLESDNKQNELSKEESITLAIVKKVPSIERKEYFKKYGIKNYETNIATLKEKGYLSGNNALTLKGKNYLLSFDDFGSVESFIEKLLK